MHMPYLLYSLTFEIRIFLSTNEVLFIRQLIDANMLIMKIEIIIIIF